MIAESSELTNGLDLGPWLVCEVSMVCTVSHGVEIEEDTIGVDEGGVDPGGKSIGFEEGGIDVGKNCINHEDDETEVDGPPCDRGFEADMVSVAFICTTMLCS